MRILRDEYLLSKWAPDTKDKRVLDIGCGHGEVSLAVSNYTSKIVAMDIAFPFLVKAKANLKKRIEIDLNAVQAAGMKIPFIDNSFDCVISMGGIHHIPNQSRTISEIARILKRGGVFYAFEPNRNSIFTFIDFYSQLIFNNPDYLKPFQEFLLGDKFRKKMQFEKELHPSLYSYEDYAKACAASEMSFSCDLVLFPLLPLRLLRLDTKELAWRAMISLSKLLARIPTLKHKEGFLFITAKKK